MLPEPIACLRCRFPRTLRVGDRRVCFQCRYNWQADHTAHQPTTPPMVHGVVHNSVEYPFTTRELSRLAVYRAAVRAGFYTDVLVRPYKRTSQVSATRSWE